MKRFSVFLFVAALLSSCGFSESQKEAAKVVKAKSSIDRINASEQNSQSTLKDLDD